MTEAEIEGLPCPYCDEPMDTSGAQNWSTRTKDHLVPKLLGGDNHPLNLVYCCKLCNHLKGSSTPAMLRQLANEMRERVARIERIALRVETIMADRRPALTERGA